MSAVVVSLRAPVVPILGLRRRLPVTPLWAAVGLLVCVVVVSHGYNMLHYPYLENDEGTYFSQGWAVFHLGRLAPYTYFYDHAPLGWIQIAAWQLITADHRFGYALASGRVLMLLFQLGSALLVFAIARRYSGKLWVGLLAATIFSLSTYGIFYHRRILLDNIATFWLLISIYALAGRVTLRRVWLSGVAIGVAVLSKEIAVAAIPALAVLVGRQTPRPSRPFAVVGWLALALGICSLYALLALLKGELFPAGSTLGGHHAHVSLLCSLQWQASRGGSGSLFDTSSPFWHAARSWAYSEPLLVIGGTAAAAVAVTALRRDRFVSMLGWTVLLLWLFLARGGVLLVFYLVPLLPLLALTLALVLHNGVERVRSIAPPKLGRGVLASVAAVLVAACGLLLLVAYHRSEERLWRGRAVDGQLQAVRWIQHNIPPTSRMVIDNYMWSDLHNPQSGTPHFANAQYYWKVGEDPQVRRKDFSDDWRTVNYVIATPQLVSDTAQNGFPVVTAALEHSLTVVAFNTGGWRVEVRRVDPRAPAQFELQHANARSLPACMTYT